MVPCSPDVPRSRDDLTHSGPPKKLANGLEDEKGRLFKANKKEEGKKLESPVKQINTSVESLKEYAFAYESALPLELGDAGKGLVDSIGNPFTTNVGLPPLFDELTKGITTAAMNSAFAHVPKKKGNWKESIDLNEVELERQARMIDLYLERDQLSLGVGLMRGVGCLLGNFEIRH